MDKLGSDAVKCKCTEEENWSLLWYRKALMTHSGFVAEALSTFWEFVNKGAVCGKPSHVRKLANENDTRTREIICKLWSRV
jgi:hypothetical protein